MTALSAAGQPVPGAVRGFVRGMIAAHGVDADLHRAVTEQVLHLGLDVIDQVQVTARALVRAWLEQRRHEVLPADLDHAAFLLVTETEAAVHAAPPHRPRAPGRPGLRGRAGRHAGALPVGRRVTERLPAGGARPRLSGRARHRRAALEWCCWVAAPVSSSWRGHVGVVLVTFYDNWPLPSFLPSLHAADAGASQQGPFGGSMACKSTKTWGPIPVWSAKSTSLWLFHPVSGPLDSNGIDKVRVSFELRQSSGAATIRPALRMGNDGLTWDNPVAIGTATLSTEDVSHGNDYIDVSATTKTKGLVQLGIECKNTSGAGVEQCMAALKISTKEV